MKKLFFVVAFLNLMVMWSISDLPDATCPPEWVQLLLLCVVTPAILVWGYKLFKKPR